MNALINFNAETAQAFAPVDYGPAGKPSVLHNDRDNAYAVHAATAELQRSLINALVSVVAPAIDGLAECAEHLPGAHDFDGRELLVNMLEAALDAFEDGIQSVEAAADQHDDTHMYLNRDDARRALLRAVRRA
jgi:hypothetical protein